MARRVLFYVQHILGIGHLVRAARLSRAMRAAGLEVCVVQGGMAVPDLDWGDARLEYLPAIRAGEHGYADLVDAAGSPVDDALRERRRQMLLDLFDATAPDLVLIEAFPFGRRAMRFELLPLLERARQCADPPVVACSIRDILHENRKPGLNEKTVALLDRNFDLVLVHGDPQFIRLEDSFPLAGRIDKLVRYTGIVAPQGGGELAAAPCDIVVSAGGGAVGEALLGAAVAALALPRFAALSACVITGPNLSRGALQGLEGAASHNVALMRFRSDFPALLRHVRLSVSQCGYNTAADILRAGCAAVFVPSAYQGETEQTRRARLLEARDLAAETLARAMDEAMASKPGAAVPDLEGAAACARIVAAARRRDDRDVG
jgi:predicted glycosyltransferase